MIVRLSLLLVRGQGPSYSIHGTIYYRYTEKEKCYNNWGEMWIKTVTKKRSTSFDLEPSVSYIMD